MKHRTYILTGWLVIVAFAGIVVGVSSTASATPPRVAQDKVKITFVIPELANPFYVPAIKGARSAAKKYGIDLSVVGTQQFDVQQTIALLDDALATGAQAILAVPGNPTSLNNEIEKAEAKGVYVGTAILDAPTSKRDFFIGHDTEAEGREQAMRVLRVLHHRGATGVVEAAITTCLPGSTGQERRRRGFTEGVKRSPYGTAFRVKIVAYVNATGEPAKSLANHQNLLLAHPRLEVIYPMCAISTLDAGLVVKAKNRRDIIIAGHDWLPQTLDLIEEGWINWSVGERPYENAARAVQWLAEAVRGTKPIPHGIFYSQVALATRANVDRVRKSPDASG
jgi:ABC-type sugar transport system substrate-binding protein